MSIRRSPTDRLATVAVEQEVRRQDQQVVLADAFNENLIDRAGSAAPQELAIFAEHRKVMGLGARTCSRSECFLVLA